MCWYCYWGWAEQVTDIYDKALDALDGDTIPLNYGPGHIVWEDSNFETERIQWCLDNFELYTHEEYTEEQWEIVRQSLKDLLLIPENIRCCTTDDGTGNNVNLFPPTIPIRIPKG